MKTLRWITHGWLLTALVSVSAGLLHPVPAGATVAAGDTTDQSQTTGSYEMAIGGSGPASWLKVAQIVTANKTGFLDRVRVYVDNANATGGVNVSIQTLNNGLPSGTMIGSGQIPVSTLPPSGSPNWVDVKISGTMKLIMTPGTKYAIVLSAPNSGVMRWYAAGNVYAGGGALVYSGGSWGSLSADAMFQTFVIEGGYEIWQDVKSYLWDLGRLPEGQTFTATSAGILDKISVLLGNFRAEVAPIAVSVRTVDSNGLPTNTQVASGTISTAAIPSDNYYWGDCRITPLLMTAGTKYAVLFTTSAVGVTWVVAGNVYSSGQLVSGRSGGTWVTDGAYDGTLLTHVIPPILDQRQTVGQDYGILPMGGGTQAFFTPTWSGKLTDLDVQVANQPPLAGVTFALSTAPTVTVNIKDGTGQKIGEGTTFSYPFSQSPLWFRSLVSGTTTPLLDVTAGSTYGINLTASEWGLYWLYLGALPNYNYASYILPYAEIATGPPPPPSEAITPCSGGVCPKASGGFTPADLAGEITSRFLFQELPNGKVVSVLAFNDPSPGGISLNGCTTNSEACTLTVTSFNCSDAHSARITGTYARGDEPSKTFTLELSGVAKEPGTFALKAEGYLYNLTQADIVDVTCPAVAGLVELD